MPETSRSLQRVLLDVNRHELQNAADEARGAAIGDDTSESSFGELDTDLDDRCREPPSTGLWPKRERVCALAERFKEPEFPRFARPAELDPSSDLGIRDERLVRAGILLSYSQERVRAGQVSAV